MTPQIPRPTRQPGPAAPSRKRRQLRFAEIFAASLVFWPAHGRAIVMHTGTPVPAFRQKGIEALGYPGRPVNFLVFDPSQKTSIQGYCGGVLLNERWILTATHCVQPWQASGTILVGLGTNVYYETQHRVRVKRVVTHPLYGTGYLFAPTFVDVALLELESPIEGYRDAILSQATPPNTTPITSSGFGRAGRPLSAALPAGMTGWLRGWVNPAPAAPVSPCCGGDLPEP